MESQQHWQYQSDTAAPVSDYYLDGTNDCGSRPALSSPCSALTFKEKGGTDKV